MSDDYNQLITISKEIDGLINLTTLHLEMIMKGTPEMMVPMARRLFKSIERAQKTKDFGSIISDLDSRWLSHVDDFVLDEFAIKVSVLDIDLVDLIVQSS